MFITTPGNQVFALDARNGDMLWRYQHALPQDRIALHNTNRGVALLGDMVYTATLDARVVALDARSGEVVWDTSVADNSSGYYMTLAPLAARGKVMVGVSGGELGIRGFVVALNAETGEEVWRTYTVPGPGEPGNDSWPEGAWRTGGAAVWLTGHYDPDLGLTYWGTGNPGPWIGDQRPGDNLYTNSVIALAIDTGELVAHHQYHWNGSWDWDEVSTPLLIDVERNGRTIPGLVHPGRNGYLWILEREAEAIRFVDAQPFVRQNVFTSLDPQTGRPTYNEDRKPGTGKPAEFCPSLWGGKDWPPAAYNPNTGFLYIPANENLCGTSVGEEIEYRAGRSFTGAETTMTVAPGADHIGELQAWDLNAGERVWTQEFDSQNWGPVLTTGGGLVFAGGTDDRYFRAFDARTGEILWQQRTNSGVIGVPSTYMVDGVQYIAVQSGWGVDAASMGRRIDGVRGTSSFVPQGGVVWVFALDP
jgi:alcohol dehydrogenase (cytochrome c)